MMEDKQGRQRTHKRLWLALAITSALLLGLIVPPWVSLSRYKSRITQLMATSLGRPVRLSSVELRLLPRPGFVLTDLTVEEDPAYGAEPVLHANTVTAYFRLLSLWRGRLEIGQISVDEASLNLVRTPAGHWNLETLFHSAAQTVSGAGPRRPAKLPYLEATNSRINIKDGAEKLPFSLIESDISFWQEDSGDWRLRLRGQPARTDVSLDLADTGTVRLEATVRKASELRQMPIQLDLDWRESQLGQLTRLIVGSDPGWRGDLTGELHLEGTAEAARVLTRLRADGVHRAEFAPAAPLDFDARCGFDYHFFTRALQNLTCDSPLGDGHIRLAGDMPAANGLPRLSVELDKLPVQAGLDAIRTVRSDFGLGLQAKGTVSGKMTYAELPAQTELAQKPSPNSGKIRQTKTHPASTGPLTGSFVVEGLQLSGDGQNIPMQQSRLELDPLAVSEGQPQALVANFGIPAGGAGVLGVQAQISLSGYRLKVQGQASMAQAKELAHLAGVKQAAALDSLAGDPLNVDLNAEGPWLPVEKIFLSSLSPVAPAAPVAGSLGGTVTLHNANWKSDFLANPVSIAQATLHLDNGAVRWDPVAFSYGPVKGTVSLNLPQSCASAQPCPPTFQAQFGTLDASALQAAILGAHEPGTLLSTLIAKLRPASAPVWPQAEGTVKVDSLILGPVTLRDATATLRIDNNGAQLTALDAAALGGRLHATGSLSTPSGDQGKPAYTFEASLEKLNPAAVGQLAGQRWSGGDFNASGKVELSGFTEKDLSASAKGALHFEWRHGIADARSGVLAVAASAKSAPPTLRFDQWTADAEIANGSVTLKQNVVAQGATKRSVSGSAPLMDQPKPAVAPKAMQAKR